MKARSVSIVRPPSNSTFSPLTSPLTSAFISSWGSSSLLPTSNGPERLTSTSPPSLPSALTFTERSSSPLSTPSRLALSTTFCGSSPLLLLVLSPPPQAAKTVARVARVANRARIRKRLKGKGSSGFGEQGRSGSLRTGRGILPPAPHSRFDRLVDEAHH